jgi:hypothetical protein
MDEGSKSSTGVSIATKSFSKEDNLYICELLKSMYNLKVTCQSAGIEKQYKLKIHKESMEKLQTLIKPYMVGSMLNKINL